jgi:hypothetical protein
MGTEKMNANGRRCREFNNRFKKFARICGRSYSGGRRIHASTAGLTVHEAIARERETAKRIAASKGKKK